MRRGASATVAAALAAAALVAGCSYAAPADRSGVESAAPLPDGSVAVAFRRLRYRPAKGLAAFPDGGVPRYLNDADIIGVLSPGGGARILLRRSSPGVHGTSSVTLRASSVDPDHLLVLRSWQPKGAGASTSSWARLNWRDGRLEPYPDFARELKAQGRRLGAAGFGDVRALDAAGALLIGAEGGQGGEIWVHEPGRPLRRIDGFKHFYGVAGDELHYWRGDEAVLRNWRTGAVRLVARYDPASRITSRYLRDDPALRATEAQAPQPAATITSGGRSVSLKGHGGARVELAAPLDWFPR